MFPDIKPKDGCVRVLDNSLHQGVVLIACMHCTEVNALEKVPIHIRLARNTSFRCDTHRGYAQLCPLL